MDQLLLTLLGEPSAWSDYLFVGLIVYIGILIIVSGFIVFITVGLHQNNERKYQKWKALEDEWEPLILDFVAGSYSVETIQEKIKPSESLFFVDYLSRYAERLIGHQKKLVSRLAAPYLEKIAPRLKTGDSEQKARAIQTLSVLALDKYKNEIADTLNDESPLVTMLAARCLSEGGYSEFLPVILDKIPHFRAWNASFLASMLTSMGPESSAFLREELKDENKPYWVKIVILRALRQLNDWESVPYATTFLTGDHHFELKAAALQLLSRMGNESHLPLIRELAHSDNGVLRLHAIKALGNMGDEQDRPLLHKQFEDPSRWIALQAGHTLKRIGDLAFLIDIEKSDHPRAKLAQQILFDFQSDLFLSSMAEQADFAPKVQHWFHILERKDTTEGWKLLKEVFFNPKTHNDVKYAIAQELTPKQSELFYQEALSELIVATDEHPMHLVQALKNLGNPNAVDVLEQTLLKVPDWELQLEVLDALLAYDTPEVQQFLGTCYQKLLENKSPFKMALDAEQMETLKSKLLPKLNAKVIK